MGPFVVTVEEPTAALPEDDQARLADLHARSIDQGFLVSLGRPSLARIYGAFATHRLSHLYVARDERGVIVGLAVTSRDLRSLYGHFLLRGGLRVLPAVLRRLASWRTAVAVTETLAYPFRRTEALEPKTADLELISLCVDEHSRGRGIARGLMDWAVADFREEGGGSLRIVTGRHQVAAHALYESLGARHVGDISVHRGVASRVFDLEVEG